MTQITVNELREKMNQGTGVTVIDVRTGAEHRAVHINGVRNIPVEFISQHIDELKQMDVVYVHCHSGGRSAMVCEDLALHGVTQLVDVKGGIQAWIKQGFPVVKTKKWAIPVMRQVMIIAGGLVLSGVVLSHFVAAPWIWLSAAVGTGLLYAGLSGHCMMSDLLSKMPWNR